MKLQILSCILLLAPIEMAAGADRNSLDVRVTGITDGDTITVLDSLKIQHKVRLAGIDSPEGEQPYGDRSKQNLSQLLLNKDVHIDWAKSDRYGRFIATVHVAQVDASLAQLNAGMAWHDKEFEKEQTPRDRREYAAAEQKAHAGRIGMWAGKNPVAPWEWRRGLTSGPVKKSRSNICHEPASSSYKATTNFESFPTLAACLASGGQRPKIP